MNQTPLQDYHTVKTLAAKFQKSEKTIKNWAVELEKKQLAFKINHTWLIHDFALTQFHQRQKPGRPKKTTQKPETAIQRSQILKPPQLRSDCLICIETHISIVECSNQHYSEEFIEVMKSYNYRYKSKTKKWQKTAEQKYTKHRAAEIGHTLLLQGFPIKLHDIEIIQKIEQQSFSLEPHKIIDICNIAEYSNYLQVSWILDDLYEDIKKNLYGSQYCKKHKIIIVPIYFYQEIYAFAEEYDFLITDKAQKQIEAGKDNIELMFHLKPLERQSQPKKDKTLFKQLIPKDEIDDELKDDTI